MNPPPCCWTGLRQREHKRALKKTVEATIDEFAEEYQSLCLDAFNPDGLSYFAISPRWANFVFPSFGDKVHGDDSCDPPCGDRFRPICRAGKCVSPTCSDAKEFCEKTSGAGERARLWCPVTCGCNKALSPLVKIGKNEGCAPSCREKVDRQIRDWKCRDEQKDSKEFREFVKAMKHKPKDEEAVLALGCKHVFRDRKVWCATKYKTFCPESCGCKSGDTGCPTICPSTPPVRNCADWADHEFRLVAAAAVPAASASTCKAAYLEGLCSILQVAAICPVTCSCEQGNTDANGYCIMHGCTHTYA